MRHDPRVWSREVVDLKVLMRMEKHVVRPRFLGLRSRPKCEDVSCSTRCCSAEFLQVFRLERHHRALGQRSSVTSQQAILFSVSCPRKRSQLNTDSVQSDERRWRIDPVVSCLRLSAPNAPNGRNNLKLLVTSATLLGTSATLVVTMFPIRNGRNNNPKRGRGDTKREGPDAPRGPKQPTQPVTTNTTKTGPARPPFRTKNLSQPNGFLVVVRVTT